jgi:transcriptional regulator with XRE-family HTH domain
VGVGQFLCELGRRVCGRTQAEVARRCDLHRTFVGSVERGERNISILNLRRIAEVLRVPLADAPRRGKAGEAAG